MTQTDNIQSHIMQQEAHYLQQKSLMNPMYNSGYSHLPPGQDSQYPPKQADNNTFSHVQQGISNSYDQKPVFDHINNYPQQPQYSPNSTSSSNSNQTGKELKMNEQEFLPEFAASKSDPKYQTLPYNTKFPPTATSKLKQSGDTNSKCIEQNQDKQNQNVANVNHMTVHSTPLSIVNKSLATPLSQTETTYQQEPTYPLQKSDSSNRCNQEGKENLTYQQNSRLSHNNNENAKNAKNTLLKGSSPNLISSINNTINSIGFGVSINI